MQAKVKMLCVAAIVLLGWCGPLAAALIPVFDYNFPASGDNLNTTPTVTDLSVAGNDATATSFSSSGLSTTIPAGKSGKSVDFGSTIDSRTIATDAFDLLNTTAVAANGGFTYDVWVRPTTATIAASGARDLISYAGSDPLFLVAGQVRFYTGVGIVTGPTLVASTWYHIVAEFDTLGNLAEADLDYPGEYKVGGELRLYVDDVLSGSSEAIKNGSGDSYDRAIGIGAHPLGLGWNDFGGLIYNPQVSLGIVPEPSTAALVITGLFGLLAYAWRKRR